MKCKLENVLHFKNGKKKPNSKGNIPIYGGNGILGYTDKYNAFNNSIIIGRVGAYCGCVYKCESECWVSDNAILGQVKENYDYMYVYYLMKTLNIHDLHVGSGQPLMTQDILNNIIVDIPCYKDQVKIGKILNNIDKKIELNNQTNDNLLEIGKSSFKRWLENCNDEKYIYEIADEIIDYEKNRNSKVKLLNSSDITENVFPKVEYVENKNLKGHFKKRFKKYDILYSQIRPNNHHFGYALIENCEEYLISTRFMVVRNKPNLVSSPLLYFYLTSDKAISDFTAKTESRSGTFPQGNFEDLSSYRVKYSANQIQITNILDNVLNKFYKNNIENELLEEIRDTLLPKLMNGEIDLDKIKI